MNKDLQAAANLVKTQPLKAIETYKTILNSSNGILFFKLKITNKSSRGKSIQDDRNLYLLFRRIVSPTKVCKLFKCDTCSLSKELAALLRSLQTLLIQFPKAKTAKICNTFSSCI